MNPTANDSISYGLPNIGNSCYINSLYQIFIKLPVIEQYLLKINPDWKSPFDSIGFFNDFILGNNFGKLGCQEDADEVYQKIVQKLLLDNKKSQPLYVNLPNLDALKNNECPIAFLALKELYKQYSNGSALDELFTGYYIDYGNCCDCALNTVNMEQFNVININTRIKRESILDLLRLENNPIPCSSCQTTDYTNRHRSLYSLPYILVFHVQRGKFIDGKYKTDTTTIDAPLKIDLSNDISDYNPNKSIINASYELVGLIIHLGSPSSGHYYAQVFQGGRLITYNDNQVSYDELDLKHYSMAFYRRIL